MTGYGLLLAAGLLPSPAFAAGAGDPAAGHAAAPIDTGRTLLPVTTGFLATEGGRAEGGLAVSSPSAAPAVSTSQAAAADAVPELPPEQCFCLQPQPPSPFHPIPYYLGQLTDVSPRCAVTRMRMELNEKPVFERLVLCDELKKCWRDAGRFREKELALEKERAAARARLKACCPAKGAGASGCDEKCLKKWEDTVRVLELDIRKNDEGAAEAREKCVEGFISERARKSSGRKPPAVAPGDR